MKVTIQLGVLLIVMISCTGINNSEQINELHRLEFKRISEVGSFDKFLNNDKNKIKILVADAIAKIGNTVHQPVLIKLLEEENPALIKKTLFALGQIGDQDSLLFSLLDNPRYMPFHKNIIMALGHSRNEFALLGLLGRLPGFSDTLQVAALYSIAFIAPNNFNNKEVIDNLRIYLQSDKAEIRAAAAYFFSRHTSTSSLYPLIRMSLESGSISDKYRLKAISRALENYSTQSADSAILDTLSQRIKNDLNNKSLDWQHKLYELAILRIFDKESAYRLAIPYLTDSNPHLRRAAIESIATSDSLDAKQALLKAYPDASWADKGFIILALSRKYPDVTYPLIQQNLDKGNLYFKQLLLRSLSIIKNGMSIEQLKQFLHVPNNRLRSIAFEELWKLRYIGYQQAQNFLSSKDLVLTSLAVGWITEHPEWINFEDLTNAYRLFIEPSAIEVKIEILKALALGNDERTNAFFVETYQQTSSFLIASQIEKILRERNFSFIKRTDLYSSLFVPESINFDQESIQIQIITEKGDMVLKLFTDVAPATVSNFCYLIEKGFYNNLSFHRVVSDFVIQGGDPRGDGWGGPDYSIPCEYNEKPFLRGTLGMATAGKDTGGCQFFICLSEQPHLNSRFTVFGQVVSGMEVADIIEIDDIVKQINILK